MNEETKGTIALFALTGLVVIIIVVIVLLPSYQYYKEVELSHSSSQNVNCTAHPDQRFWYGSGLIGWLINIIDGTGMRFAYKAKGWEVMPDLDVLVRNRIDPEWYDFVLCR